MGLISHFQPSRQAAARLVHRALDLGVNLIDTAASYFESEEILGYALQGRLDQVILATKSFMRGGRQFRDELEQSFRRLRTDHIQIYQLHHVQYRHELEQILAPGGAYELLLREKERGRVGHIGITSHHPGVLVEALQTGHFDTVQFPFNAIEAQSFRQVLDTANELDIGTLSMKPLSGGRLETVDAALRFCAAHPISTILAGCSTVAQVEQDVAVLSGDIAVSEQDQQAMEQEIAQLSDLFCRRCRYCEKDCPAGLPISDIMRHHDYLVLNQFYARDEYRKLFPKVDACQSCGACEEICPYNLPVRQMLRTADQELTRGRLMGMAISVLHHTGLYDVVRKTFFRLGGARFLPRHNYLHHKGPDQEGRP